MRKYLRLKTGCEVAWLVFCPVRASDSKANAVNPCAILYPQGRETCLALIIINVPGNYYK